MANIYYLNCKGSNPKSGKALERFLQKFDASQITIPIPNDAEGVLFIHGMHEDTKINVANKCKNLHLIDISSEPDCLLVPDKDIPNLHKCRFPITALENSPVEVFLKDYINNSNLDWNKIEPHRSTEILIALYLLELSELKAPEVENLKCQLRESLEKEHSNFMSFSTVSSMDFRRYLAEINENYYIKGSEEDFSSSNSISTVSIRIKRSLLKHYWLENEVLCRTPNDVLRLRHGKGWPVLRSFPGEAEKALALADEVEATFSHPERFVVNCAPLSMLSERQHKALREAIHTVYLKCFDAHNAAQQVREAAKHLQVVLTLFLAEWDKPEESIKGDELQARWQVVLNEAEILRKTLIAIPKGIILP